MTRICVKLATGLTMAALVACQDVPRTETVTPDDMFIDRSAPVGAPSADPYRPEPTVKMMDVPTGPKAEPPRGGR